MSSVSSGSQGNRSTIFDRDSDLNTTPSSLAAESISSQKPRYKKSYPASWSLTNSSAGLGAPGIALPWSLTSSSAGLGAPGIAPPFTQSVYASLTQNTMSIRSTKLTFYLPQIRDNSFHRNPGDTRYGPPPPPKYDYPPPPRPVNKYNYHPDFDDHNQGSKSSEGYDIPNRNTSIESNYSSGPVSSNSANYYSSSSRQSGGYDAPYRPAGGDSSYSRGAMASNSNSAAAMPSIKEAIRVRPLYSS